MTVESFCAAYRSNSANPATAEIQIRLDERGRLARELHDGTAQLLVLMQLRLLALKQTLSDDRSCGILDEIEKAIADIHREIRAVVAVNPPSMPFAGTISDALRQMAGDFGRGTGTRVALRLDDRLVLSGDQQASLYRIAQEALANACRHGRAKTIRISLGRTRAGVRMVVDDDGAGLSATPAEGAGLPNIRERVRALGGRVAIRGTATGTRIHIWLRSRNAELIRLPSS